MTFSEQEGPVGKELELDPNEVVVEKKSSVSTEESSGVSPRAWALHATERIHDGEGVPMAKHLALHTGEKIHDGEGSPGNA